LEPVDHRLGVESLGHLPIVQVVLRDTTTRVPHYTEEQLWTVVTSARWVALGTA